MSVTAWGLVRGARRTATLLGCASWLVAAGARAQHANLCLTPHEQGQELRRNGRLRDARSAFRECTRDACPGPVRLDCTQWVAELDSTIPTVVLEARDDQGRDVTGLHLYIDGKTLDDYADGRPFAVDPGPHALRVEAQDRVFEQQMVAHEGEKDRVVSIVFPAQRAASAASPPGAVPALPPPSVHRPIPMLAYVFGGIGIATLGSFAAFDTVGWVEHRQLRSSCAPGCDPSQVSPVRTEYLVGDLSLAGSLVAIGLTTWLVLTRPTLPAAEVGQVTPWLGPTGAGVYGAF